MWKGQSQDIRQYGDRSTSGTTKHRIVDEKLQKMTLINQHERMLLGKERNRGGSSDGEYNGREWGICPDGGLVIHGSAH